MNAQDAKQIEVIEAAKIIGQSLITIGKTFQDLAGSLDVLLSINNVCLMPDKPMPERIEPTTEVASIDAPKGAEEAQPIEKVEPESPVQPDVKLSDIRTICVALSKKGFKDQVAEAICEHGHASQLSKVDAKYYPMLFDAVKTIEARS